MGGLRYNFKVEVIIFSLINWLLNQMVMIRRDLNDDKDNDDCKKVVGNDGNLNDREK